MTIRDLYNQITFHPCGAMAFNVNCDLLLDNFKNREKARYELLRLIDSLEDYNGDIRNGYCIVPYAALDPDGGDHLILSLVTREDILTMPRIDEFEKLSTSCVEEKLAPGERSFWSLSDNEIIEKLGAIRSLPEVLKWKAIDISTVLSAEIYSDIADLFIVDELLHRCLSTKLLGSKIWDSPLAFLDSEIPIPTTSEDECWYLEEDHRDQYSKEIRRTQLYSYINFYQAILRTYRGIVEDQLFSGTSGNDESFSNCIILKNAVKCIICGDIVESLHTHDRKTCSCGTCTVDGGKDYIRRVGDPSCWIELSYFKCIDDED